MDLLLQQLILRDEREASSDPVLQETQVSTIRHDLEAQTEIARTLAKENKSLRNTILQLERQKEETQQLITAKNKSIEVLQDDLFTSQLELNQSDETIKALRTENRDLVDRWIKRIDQEAAQQLEGS